MRQRVWLSYDLGIKGDYEGMYAWLDRHGAEECGDSVASFLYECATDDLLGELKDDLKGNVEIDEKKNRVYVVRYVGGTGRVAGRFIFGRRRNAPWIGAAGNDDQSEDTN